MFGRHFMAVQSVFEPSRSTFLHTPSRLCWSLIPLLFLTVVGCRTPWQQSLNSEPSFDRLLEIEQSQKSGGRSDVLASQHRPGKPTYQATRQAQNAGPATTRANRQVDVDPDDISQQLADAPAADT